MILDVIGIFLLNQPKSTLCYLFLTKRSSSSTAVFENTQCQIERLMLADSALWKSARSIIHQFYISVYFMEPYWKREFAVLYAKNYKLIWRNHVNNADDTVSLTDLAVQMFTVLSLSKYLLTHYDLLHTIMDTLIEQCKTTKGKLAFARGRGQRSTPEFKRAQFMLFDLKYCLTSTPLSSTSGEAEWSEPLRVNFVHGFKTFVDFIKLMHGMDALKRLTQHHVEFEPEWETSFNLLIKLQKSIGLLVEWCASDKSVYMQTYKHLVLTIRQVEQQEALFAYTYDKRSFSGHQHVVIDYAVARQEVSIHATLTRLYAALYPHMARFELTFATCNAQLGLNSAVAASATSATRLALAANVNSKMALALIEPSLRALVLVAQTNAGMWKRNGFSLLSQVYFYSNIKCRQEMLDRDIMALQMGASVLEPNQFLLNVIGRFGLLAFLTDDAYDTASSSTAASSLSSSSSSSLSSSPTSTLTTQSAAVTNTTTSTTNTTTTNSVTGNTTVFSFIQSNIT